MHIQRRTRRVRAMAIGALVASVMSIGATAGPASASTDSDAKVVSVKVGADVGPVSLRSGIRW